ncbi:hypothetical protein HKCCSP123_11370 [Rhodobacterales bacterium HKCCSP123]|nr:hypothetical protein [Rhodobacterales bacterium HKCCSP123]
MWALKLIANVIFPAAAGFIVTLQVLLPLAIWAVPGLQPTAMAVIPLTGLVTAMICIGIPATRRLIARGAA